VVKITFVLDMYNSVYYGHENLKESHCSSAEVSEVTDYKQNQDLFHYGLL